MRGLPISLQLRYTSLCCVSGTGNRPAAVAILVACGNNLALCLMSLERWEAASKALADVLAIDCNNIKATERHVKVLANLHEFAQAQSLFDSAKSRGMNINQALLSEIARARRDAQRATSHMYSKIFAAPSTKATSRPSAAAAAAAEELEEPEGSGSAASASVPASASDLTYQPSVTAAGR